MDQENNQNDNLSDGVQDDGIKETTETKIPTRSLAVLLGAVVITAVIAVRFVAPVSVPGNMLLASAGGGGGGGGTTDIKIKPPKKPIPTYCGDTFIQRPNDAGVHENCDPGKATVVECIPPYGIGCSYCGSDCLVKMIPPKEYCGDGTKQEPDEKCDGADGISPGQKCSNDCKTVATIDDLLDACNFPPIVTITKTTSGAPISPNETSIVKCQETETKFFKKVLNQCVQIIRKCIEKGTAFYRLKHDIAPGQTDIGVSVADVCKFGLNKAIESNPTLATAVEIGSIVWTVTESCIVDEDPESQ